MGKYAHRQPIATWSGVVLLSALLLSPVTAATFLRALAESGNAPSRAAEPANPNNPTPNTQHPTPNAQSRRAADEETKALRAAALAGQFRAVRLDSDPDNPDNIAPDYVDYAILLPARAVLRVPDDPALAALPPSPDATPAERHALRRNTPPRAPPFGQ